MCFLKLRGPLHAILLLLPRDGWVLEGTEKFVEREEAQWRIGECFELS